MVASDEFLSSLGISVGVGHPSLHQPGVLDTYQSPTCEYPTGAVSTLSATTVITTITLVYMVFIFRKILARYIGNWFAYALSTRTDLNVRLTYEFWVGAELISSVTMTNGDPETLGLEDVATATTSGRIELEEVVVLP